MSHAVENHPKSKSLIVTEDHAYAKNQERDKKHEDTILEIVQVACINKSTVTDDLDPEGAKAINIDSLNDRQMSAILGVSRNIFNLYFALIEKKLKVGIDYDISHFTQNLTKNPLD